MEILGDRRTASVTRRQMTVALWLVRCELRRYLRPFILSVVAVGVAVALLTAFDVVSSSSDVSLHSRIARALGGADARINVVKSPRKPVRVEDLVPTAGVRSSLGGGAVVEPLIETTVAYVAAGKSVAAVVTLADQTTPLVQPMFPVVAGHSATKTGEVALSRALAERLDLQIGDSVETATSGRRLRVCGLLLDPVDTSATFATMPLSDESLASVLGTGDDSQVSVIFLAKASQAQLDASGLPYLNRQAVVDRAGETAPQTVPTLIGALALVVCVSAAVFIVTARRQRRTLGVLDLVGAGPAFRRLIPVLMTVPVAVSGLVAGVGLGFLGAAAVLPLLAARANQQWPHPGLPWRPAVLAAVAIAITSLVSAVTATRALRKWGARRLVSGRETRQLRTSRHVLLLPGLLTGVGVVGLAAGGVLKLAGIVIPAAMLVSIALSAAIVQVVCDLFRRVGEPPVWVSVAVRNLNRVSSLPRSLTAALGAVASFGSLAALLLSSLSLSSGYIPQLPYTYAAFSSTQELTTSTVERAGALLGATNAVQFRDAVRVSAAGLRSYLQVRNPLQTCLEAGDDTGDTKACAQRTGWLLLSPRVTFMTADQVSAYLGQALTPAEARDFAAGVAISLYPQLVEGGHVTLWSGQSAENSLNGSATQPSNAADTMRLKALVPQQTPPPSELAPSVILPTTWVGQQRLSEGSRRNVVFSATTLPLPAAEDEARAVLLSAAAGDGTLTVERGDPHLPLARAVILIASTGMGIVGTVIAALLAMLTSSQLRQENAVLDAIGADSRTRRLLAATQVILPAFVACAVGTAAGVVGAEICVGIEHAKLSLAAVPPLLAGASVSVIVAGAAASLSTQRRPGAVRVDE